MDFQRAAVSARVVPLFREKIGQICTHLQSKAKLIYVLAESKVSFMDEKAVFSLVEGNANLGIINNVCSFTSSYKGCCRIKIHCMGRGTKRRSTIKTSIAVFSEYLQGISTCSRTTEILCKGNLTINM